MFYTLKNVKFSNSALLTEVVQAGIQRQRSLHVAPAYKKGDVSDNKFLWINCTILVRQNTPKKIDFYQPASATIGADYRIVIKSNYINVSTKRKVSVYTYNDVIIVVAEHTA